MTKIGVLLTNIGTPDAPTTKAVRRYLKEFLSDPRVIELPKILWLPILRLFILTTRPRNSAALYKKIWRTNGAPLLSYTRETAQLLQKSLRNTLHEDFVVAVGMRYGNPSIQSALEEFRKQNIERFLILPLFPQYSGTSTASTFDAVNATIGQWRHLPALRTIKDYAGDTAYIQAISQSIRQHQTARGKKHLLFSFHSIPQRFVDNGDPYKSACELTAKLVAKNLELTSSEWSISFQSRLGPTKWIKPYTDKILASMPHRGIQELQVVCPGFAVDCLETLEEIAIRGKEQFLKSGGKSFEYIPALNCSHAHINMLTTIVSQHTQGWVARYADETTTP